MKRACGAAECVHRGNASVASGHRPWIGGSCLPDGRGGGSGWVWGLGVWGLGFRFWGLGFRFWGLGVWGLGFRV